MNQLTTKNKKHWAKVEKLLNELGTKDDLIAALKFAKDAKTALAVIQTWAAFDLEYKPFPLNLNHEHVIDLCGKVLGSIKKKTNAETN